VSDGYSGIREDQQGFAAIGRKLHRMRLRSKSHVEPKRSDEKLARPGDLKAPKDLRTNCPLKMTKFDLITITSFYSIN
jgi:hypothetical protein